MESKVCTKCKAEKPVGEFGQSKANRDGLNRKCKECASAYGKAWHYKNRGGSLRKLRNEKQVKEKLLLVVGKKTCGKCGAERDLSEFHRRSSNPDGKSLWCKDCDNAYTKDYVCKNRKRIRDNARVYQKAHRLGTILSDSRSAAKKRGHAACKASVDDLKAAFTGRCDICGVPETECTKKLAMDHNHISGDLRGFLCSKCNYGLGNFKDSQERLLAAACYLESSLERNKASVTGAV